MDFLQDDMLIKLFRITSAVLLVWIIAEVSILVGKLMETKNEEEES